ncbi:NADH-quinone oxidoreductase subunit NuoK [Dehalococcoides mccartyi]|uniref:NADH-quinone oxidoreductase subunit NuoK n=1 Tax=Dehalococcoides mccartyi TaxID=61435 RepID=UPI00099B8D8F|nr:NADH-quinone oxidoreductase subunit NuoK [Dehalococcoides mccartyi]AQX73264.1 NADH-quinone oxidoreductase subunit K [Dehalococcoides mccartyi]
MGLTHFLVLAVILFCIGLYGALVKKSAVVILMCIEIMLNAVTIAAVAFNRFASPESFTGQIFTLFIIVVAAAEATIGLAIIISIYKNRDTIDATKIDLMKW